MSELHVDIVLKSFGHKQVLTDIYLSCKKGEILGLLGKNGAGKSTLLKIIFGSLSADNKFVKVGNKQIFGLGDANGIIAYLPQDGFLPVHLKIKTIVSYMCSKERYEIIKNLEVFKSVWEKKSKYISSGEKRLVEIFCIIYSDVKFVMIDEPFNGVAPIYKEEVKRCIKEQTKEKAFIITDHDYRNIMDISDRILLLFDGGIKAIRDHEELQYWKYLPGV